MSDMVQVVRFGRGTSIKLFEVERSAFEARKAAVAEHNARVAAERAARAARKNEARIAAERAQREAARCPSCFAEHAGDCY